MSNLSNIKNPIHIVLATDNDYAKYCCVTIASILFNSDKSDFYEFHILDGGIDHNNKKRFKLKGYTNYNVTFYDMSAFDVSQFSILLKHTTVATYYRLFLTKILPENIDKILYLDCDLIAVKNIKRLWDTDITGYFVAVVMDYLDGNFDYLKPVINESFCYFNAGVILFDLKQLRKNNFSKNCLNFYKQYENQLYCQDQDVLNYVLAGKCKYLPISYNMQTTFYYKKCHKIANQIEFKYCKDNPVIVHYTCENKPWNFFSYHPMKKEYQKYIKMVNSLSENLLFYLKKLCCVILVERSSNIKVVKIFDVPIYELNRYRIKIIKLFNIPVYYKFRIKNRFREYFCNLRIR